MRIVNCVHVLVAGVVVLTGCTTSVFSLDPVMPVAASARGSAENRYNITREPESPPPNFEGAEELPTPTDSEPRSRSVIYNARFNLAVGNVEEALQRFTVRLKQLGGYLAGRSNYQVTARVPADRFQQLVEEMPSFGDITDQKISSQDVMREHRDLNLRLLNATQTRDRLAKLLERAEKVEDIIKIEKELGTITGEIERLKAELQSLGDQVAYSTVQVAFHPKTMNVVKGGSAASSSFQWINQLGIERMLRDFEHTATSKAPSSPNTLLGKSRVKPPAGFLVISRDDGLKAISADDAKFQSRNVVDPWGASRDYWLKALRNHFITNQGYTLLDERAVPTDPKAKKQTDLALLFETMARGKKHRYLLQVSFEKATWSSKQTLHVTELTAPSGIFDQYAPGVRASVTVP